MSLKSTQSLRGARNPEQVFRQFAWNLAGTLAAQKKGATRRTAKPGTSGGNPAAPKRRART